MSETGTTYRRPFKGLAIEAAEVRAWTRRRADHPDAPTVANELFIAVLGSGADVIEMQLSTAGDRLRVTATGSVPLFLRHSHGPGWLIVHNLSRTSGTADDGRSMWALMGPADEA